MRLTKAMKDLCEEVGAKIVRRDGSAYLKYDPHGEVFVKDEADFLDAISTYKGGHPNWDYAFLDYMQAAK